MEGRQVRRDEFPSDDNPVRHNVESSIRLRDKIQHRFEELLITAA